MRVRGESQEYGSHIFSHNSLFHGKKSARQVSLNSQKNSYDQTSTENGSSTHFSSRSSSNSNLSHFDSLLPLSSSQSHSSENVSLHTVEPQYSEYFSEQNFAKAKKPFHAKNLKAKKALAKNASHKKGINKVRVDKIDERKVVNSTQKKSNTNKLSTIIAIILMVFGLSIVGYLVGGTLYNNYTQQVVVQKIENLSAKKPQNIIDEDLKKAQEFNKVPLNGPLVDPWLKQYVPSGILYKRYLSTLDEGNGLMGKVVIPKIHVDLPIYHGTTDDVLARGVGHLFGTSLPVGGKGTHSVLTAHSGLAATTMFDDLPQLKKGDVFYIQVVGRKLKYEVRSTEVVLPDRTESLHTHPGQDEVTLVTCTPYGINTHRLFVHGFRVPFTQKDESNVEKKPHIEWKNWMTVTVLSALALVLVFILVLWKSHRKNNKQ